MVLFKTSHYSKEKYKNTCNTYIIIIIINNSHFFTGLCKICHMVGISDP